MPNKYLMKVLREKVESRLDNSYSWGESRIPNMVAFLASDAASAMSGVTVDMSGGLAI